MRTLTTAMKAAVAKTDGQGFRHLLQIDPEGTTPLYLDCEARRVGSTTYIGELITVSPIDESMDSASDLTIEVRDTPANRAAIDLAVDVKLYLWAVGTADSDKDLKIWGEISDPIVYGGGLIRFDIISRQAQQWNQSIGNPLLKADYPGVDPDEIGKTLPIIYGEHKDHLCLAIDAGSISTLWDSISKTLPGVYVSDPSIFPQSGIIQIDQEQISYTHKDAQRKHLLGAIRGINGTVATTHDKGAVIAEIQTTYDYLIADHPIHSAENIKVDDVLQSGGDFTVLKNDNGVAKIRFTTRPSLKKSVDIEVDEDITVSANQDAHVHTTGDALLTTKQYAHQANKTIASGGMTNRPGSPSNEITFPALPSRTVSGNTYIKLTGNSSIRWEIGIWTGSDGIFSSRINWDVIVSGSGSWSGTFNGVSDNLWIRKVTTTSYFLVMNTAYRNVTYAKSTSMTQTTPRIFTTRSGGIELTGNSVSETVIGKVVTCDVIGWQDDGSGSITGAANSAISNPRHIVQHLLKTYGLATDTEVTQENFPSIRYSSFVFTSTIKVAVRIDEPTIVRDIIKSIEGQTRTIITYTGGRWRMTDRPSSTAPTPDVTILDANVKRNEDGASSMRESRSGLRSLVNKYVYRAGLRSDGTWALSGINNALESQSLYGVRQRNIDFTYLFERPVKFGYEWPFDYYVEWLSANKASSNPNRKIITMDVTAALYALEVGDVVNYNSTKHSIDLYFECIAINAKGLTDSTITLEQI